MPEPLLSLLDGLSGTLYVTDAEAVILYANASMERRTGFEVAEIIGRKPRDLWGGRMDAPFYQGMWRVIKDQKLPLVAEVDNVAKDGTEKRERLHLAHVTDSKGELRYLIELQPAKDRHGFVMEFTDTFSRQHELGTVVFGRMLQWLASGKSQAMSQGSSTWQACDRAAEALSKTYKSLAALMQAELVLPMQERFHMRQEDRILVAAAQEDPKAFKALYSKYHDAVTAYFLNRLNYDGDLAQELVQEVFLRAFRYLPGFRVTNASYRTYLIRIAHNVLVNHYRAKRPVSLEDVPEPSVAVDKRYERNLLTDSIWKNQDILTHAEQSAMWMRYKEGMSVQEIAVILQKTENAVKLHLSRARKKLQELLNQ